MNEKLHLGENVYAQRNRFGDLVLTTENALRITNAIILDSDVLQNLQNFLFLTHTQQNQNQNQENL
jgi:hypothetical protein